ncbi:unnamed protein product [Ambrosiozyma monospora]|uniref:Unnamed protein product n=1 Tax=Ambrosiozyma monospora TaxID=43982 RepID=A0A9W7DFI5_AMBMO|nr:unnamed protein product [Ambrosiozyma monospora]
MSSASWKQDLLNNLVQRDEAQQKDDSVYQSLQVSSLESELDTLRKDDTKAELEKALKQISQLNEQLASQLTKLDAYKRQSTSKDVQLSRMEKNIRLLTDGYKKLQDKFSRLQEETKMKNQNIEVVNDDLLSLQIENNLLNKKVEDLTLERDKLIQRWMNKVSKDAEVLNDANKVLELNRKTGK